MIYPEKLTLAHAAALAPRLRAEDVADLKDHGAGAEGALARALVEEGEAWAIISRKEGWPDTVIGAGGWTATGYVWTLWADLSVGQARDVLRMAIPYARILAIRSGRPLENWFREGNEATASFLRATGCVDFTEERAMIGDRLFRRFKLKSLEDLPRV